MVVKKTFAGLSCSNPMSFPAAHLENSLTTALRSPFGCLCPSVPFMILKTCSLCCRSRAKYSFKGHIRRQLPSMCSYKTRHIYTHIRFIWMILCALEIHFQEISQSLQHSPNMKVLYKFARNLLPSPW